MYYEIVLFSYYINKIECFFRFHQEKNEPSMGRNIVPPLCDDQRLSVDEYRNRLYALMKKSPSR